MDTEQIRHSLTELGGTFAQELAQAGSRQALEQLRVKYLGRKSPLSVHLKRLGSLPAEERALLGKDLNILKVSFENRLAEAQQRFSERPAQPPVDVTLPGAPPPMGRLHPVTQTMQEIVACFVPMGFEVVEGPELDNEFNNFDALNIPRDHPSRENFDTFFIDPASGGQALPDPIQSSAGRCCAATPRRCRSA